MSTPFGRFVADAHAAGRLVVQPRMGFDDPATMRDGLLRTRDAAACTVGTITLDSYTRVGDSAAARAALAAGVPLNGYPIVAHGPRRTGEMLAGVRGPGFPVQVRHGSARPQAIVDALVAAGLDATEGGPVSYCLPYSRLPLRDAVDNWRWACERLTRLHDVGRVPHLETFGGCMLGQLCPPGMLVAISVLEGMFFAQQGLRSVSLSYAQQTHPGQDEEAVRALRLLASELLPDVEWHVVVYAYMGVYPRTPGGATRLLAAAARLAVRAGAARLIVKTVAEAHRIPTIEENVAALELAGRVAADVRRAAGHAPVAAADPSEAGPVGVGTTGTGTTGADSAVYREARALVDAVLDLDPRLATALPTAFERGHLDIPYCLHPDNAGRVTSHIDHTGRLRWSSTGSLPIGRPEPGTAGRRTTAAALVAALSYVERRFDRPPARPTRVPA